MMAGAYVSNNQVVLSWQGAFVKLPAGLLGSFSTVSFEAWVSTSASAIGATIFQFGAWSHKTFFSLKDCSTGTMCLKWKAPSGVVYTSASGVTFGSQANMHIVVTVAAGSVAQLYVNSVSVANLTVPMTALPAADLFHVGEALNSSAPFLNGAVNEFRVWAGSLSHAQITARYALGPGELPSIPVFCTFGSA